MDYPIVLTCDRTLASAYHGRIFFGFSACIPRKVVPDWLYYPLFCPPADADVDGRLLFANCGLRKIEAALLRAGFLRTDVVVAHPDHLHKVIGPQTRIVALSSTDPLGIGPATSTFTELWGGEGRMAEKLRELLAHPLIRHYRPVVILGGPGAWQFSQRPAAQQQLGIDYVLVGEGEITAPWLFRRIIEGQRDGLERIIAGEAVPQEEIPDIVGGTVIGIIEITRGCARHCAFCVPTVRQVRSRPIERVINEVRVNIEAGNKGVILHGEDVLLYCSDGLRVNGEAVIKLFDRVYREPGVRFVGASHASLSSAVSSPHTIERLSKVLELGTEKHPVNYFQVGIETASPALIARHMRGKVFPFRPDDWPRVVKDGFALMHDNHFVCCATLILGLPGETAADVEQTINLVRSLRPYQSVIVPLLFAPMDTSRLEGTQALTKSNLTPLHYELIAACWDHTLDWFPAMWSVYGRNSHPLLKNVLNLFFKFGTWPIRKKIHREARKHRARI